ncbi:LysR substrate-binding domain-containing protein [Noviherbaspirillum denitrificans]|uniref:LysR family transcriptional regulator n=1 Tax=Noviherbaspirillum denitrificans TaxID=1968433 RepID=A0A254TD48_9BURK|nr:LysR substrate-binding domain-containing protein [Noviherbaspirillum denitrificans]OWW20569.1 LysR family transcriptional regulator [Noviherbaspirillum denitrificans]
MELRQLRYFVAIVDHGSLSRAARVLHIAQPALTQQVRQLEEELGAQLLHRSAQGVMSTDAGKTFYEHALAILKQVDDAKWAVAQSTNKPAGTVALGVPQSVSSALALPLLTAVREQYPEISLQLTEELSGNLIEQLKSGRINLAVLFDDGQLGAFSVTPLVEEEMMFITRTDSQFAPKGKTISLAKAMQVPLILPGLQHGVRPRIEGLARSAGLSIPHVIDINSVAILRSAIMADLGATILPVAPVLPEIGLGQMKAFPISGSSMSRTIALCSSRNIPLTNASAAVQRLILRTTVELCTKGQWPGATALT